ncbi:head completion protein, partial [Salmonella enterica]|nr:head completion protein [Salmonella enterica]EJF5114937.1 head completion protein [Salmonella enterica]
MSGPSFSISGKPVMVTPTAITNGVTFWPDLDLAEF